MAGYEAGDLGPGGGRRPTVAEELAEVGWWCWDNLGLVLFLLSAAAAYYVSGGSYLYAGFFLGVGCLAALVVRVCRDLF